MTRKRKLAGDAPPKYESPASDSEEDSTRIAGARRVIIQSLNNQIQLAAKLLKIIQEARFVREKEPEMIDEASRVYLKLIDTANRVSELGVERERDHLQRSVEKLRSALKEVGVDAGAPDQAEHSLTAIGLRLSFENEALRREIATLKRENENLKLETARKRAGD